MKDLPSSCLNQSSNPDPVVVISFPWYALRIQSRLSALAQETLSCKGYETFLPTYRCKRQWSDRVKIVDVPLFAGYLFCRMDVRETLPILTTPGIIGIVGAGRVPSSIAEDEIAATRLIVQSGLPAQEWPFLGAGSQVYINRGPLKGLEGILINTNKVDRVVVSVTMLQRSVAVEIDCNWVAPGLKRAASA